jgi:hypothetical protein
MHLRSLKSPAPDRTPMAGAGQPDAEARLPARDARATRPPSPIANSQLPIPAV